MYILNFADPMISIAALLVYALFMILGKEFKKSALPAISLFLFLATLSIYGIQFLAVNDPAGKDLIIRSIGYNAIFILLSYVSYLWVDDIEAKDKKIKSIDNSLDWFWNKV